MPILLIVFRAAERGGEGGGQIAPGSQNLGAPGNFLLGPSPFFWKKYFRAKGKKFGFLGKEPKFGMFGIWYVVGCCPKKIFSGKFFEIGIPSKKFAPGPRQALDGPDSVVNQM